jgi:hypothetical protein
MADAPKHAGQPETEPLLPTHSGPTAPTLPPYQAVTSEGNSQDEETVETPAEKAQNPLKLAFKIILFALAIVLVALFIKGIVQQDDVDVRAFQHLVLALS